MFPHFRARVSFGQQIREAAAQFILEHGIHAGAAAQAWARASHSDDDVAARIFREAVLERVCRELGERRRVFTSRSATPGAGWFDLHLDPQA